MSIRLNKVARDLNVGIQTAVEFLQKKGFVGHIGITDLQLENLKWIIDHSEPGTVESAK